MSSRDGGSSNSSGGDSGRDSDVDSGPLGGRTRQSSQGKARAADSASSRKERRSQGDRGDPDSERSSETEPSPGRKDGRDTSSDGGGGGGGGGQGLSQPARRKRPRQDEVRRKATKWRSRKAASGAASGGEGRDGVKAVEYFPVNAGALRAAVEKVPEDSLCGHRHLAPLVDLVSSGERPPVCALAARLFACWHDSVRFAVLLASYRRSFVDCWLLCALLFGPSRRALVGVGCCSAVSGFRALNTRPKVRKLGGIVG